MKRLLVALAVAVCFGSQAQAGKFLHAYQPIKNRYIVTLDASVRGPQVEPLSHALAKQFGGRLLGTMSHAMTGFGIEITEAQAHALAKHPLVQLVEEDAFVHESNEESLSFRPSHRMQPEPKSIHLFRRPLANNCPWTGYAYQCSYTDDTHWSLDRLDNPGLIDPQQGRSYLYYATGSGVRAYVFGYGIWASHVEFDNRVEAGANMTVDPDVTDATQTGGEEQPIAPDYSPANNPCNGFNGDDATGHDTAVASVIGGTNTGVAKNVTLVPVKTFNCSYHIGSKLAMTRGLDWVLSDMQSHPGARAVVNISQFMDVNCTYPDATCLNGSSTPEGQQLCEDAEGSNTYTNCVSAFENEILNVVDAQIPVVVSANNQNANRCGTQSPARMGYGNESGYPSRRRTITVGATMYDAAHSSYADQRWTCAAQPGGCDAGWSQYNQGSNYGACVSIWAPAWNVNVAGSAGPTSYRSQWPAGIAGPSSGTSFAAPYVAGVIARLLERNPSWTVDDVWQALVSRANQRYCCTPNFDPSGYNNKLVYLSPTE